MSWFLFTNFTICRVSVHFLHGPTLNIILWILPFVKYCSRVRGSGATICKCTVLLTVLLPWSSGYSFTFVVERSSAQAPNLIGCWIRGYVVLNVPALYPTDGREVALMCCVINGFICRSMLLPLLWSLLLPLASCSPYGVFLFLHCSPPLCILALCCVTITWSAISLPLVVITLTAARMGTLGNGFFPCP